MSIIRGIIVTVTVTLGTAQIAFAAESGEKVGQNVSHLLSSWARTLYVGIAACVALMFLVNRKFADLALFMLAVLVVGGFVLAPDTVASTVKSIWATVAG